MEVKEEGIGSEVTLELKLQVAVNHYMDVGNQTRSSTWS